MNRKGLVLQANKTALTYKITRKSFIKYVITNKWLYIILLPGLLYLIIFNYIPMYGVIIAFKKLNIAKGIMASPWIGFQNFIDLFQSQHFFRVFRNSLIISSLRLLWGFPVPIIIALMLNETKHIAFKRSIQTIIYIPHFISWVVVIGIIVNFLSMDGVINYIIGLFGVENINFLIEPKYFRGIVVTAEIWKEAGWGTIIYLAAISGIDPQLYEAAIVDGANRLQRIWNITIPCILGTIIVLLILRLGRILNNGFEQIFLLYNSLTLDVADVFETYSYRTGLIEGRFSFSTAIGMFKSIVGLILILATNTIARRVRGAALW